MNQRGILLETPGAWSEPLHWALRDGEQKLLTVGSNADWSIADGALLPVHATLYFDGARLCVAAAEGALLNGEPIGKDWSPVALPAQLWLGETKIHLAPSELGAPLATEPGEADRVTPIDAFPTPFIDPDATLLAMPALLASISPVAAPPARVVELAPRPAPPPHPTPSPSAPAPARSAFAHSFQGASWPKRLSVLLLPVVIGLYAIKAVRQHSAARTNLASAATSGSTRASASSSVSDSASVAPRVPSTPTPDLARAAASGSPSRPSPTSDGRTTGPTLERRAVDAFASGNYHDAALLYQRLAQENPGQAAFAVAARLAAERAKGVGHD